MGQRKLDGIRTSLWLVRHKPQDVRVSEHLHCGVTMSQFIQPFSMTELHGAE